jgi:hypothetical protein
MNSDISVYQHDPKDQNIVFTYDAGSVALPPGVLKQENASDREATCAAVTGGYFVFALQSAEDLASWAWMWLLARPPGRSTDPKALRRR